MLKLVQHTKEDLEELDYHDLLDLAVKYLYLGDCATSDPDIIVKSLLNLKNTMECICSLFEEHDEIKTYRYNCNCGIDCTDIYDNNYKISKDSNCANEIFASVTFRNPIIVKNDCDRGCHQENGICINLCSETDECVDYDGITYEEVTNKDINDMLRLGQKYGYLC